jgi:hypothetical protein
MTEDISPRLTAAHKSIPMEKNKAGRCQTTGLHLAFYQRLSA